MTGVEVFEGKFLGLKAVEEKKNSLIEDLIARVKELENSLSDERLHLEREQEATKSFQTRLHDALFTMNRREQEIDANAFVSVLLDGDCMLFLDHLMISAEQGGIDAARYLRSGISEYISSSLQSLALPPNMDIRIRVYANAKGLASTYCQNIVLDSVSDFLMFVRGFNMGHALCDFVDAGDGKECADSKLKEWFNRDLADVHCKAVFFGGSSDNGYARLLQPFAGDESLRDKIILVEGPPFAKEMAALSKQFPVARFPKVFRKEKSFPSRGVPTQLTGTSLPFSPAISQLPNLYTTASSSLVSVTDEEKFVSLLRMDYPLPKPLPSPSAVSTSTSNGPTTYASTSALATSIAFLTASMTTTQNVSTNTSATAQRNPRRAKGTSKNKVSTSTSTSTSTSKTAASPSPSQTPPPLQLPLLLINTKGQRIDQPINPSKALLHSMRSKKQCNNYHILGTCKTKNCEYEHGKRLDAAGIEVRKWIARQSACSLGSTCRDEMCILGHECPEKTCGRVGNGCRFKREMHNMNRNLAVK